MDQARVEALAAAERKWFRDGRLRSMEATSRATGTMPRGVPVSWMDELYDHPPLWVSHGAGSRFWDLDGHEYVDMYIADMSAFCGHAAAPVVRAVCERAAAGSQFLLPSKDALVVAEALARRYGMAKWQFTLSATQANAEVVRIARVRTGREKVVVFDGKYHGHLEPTLGIIEDGRVLPEYTGLPVEVTANLRIVPFNDLDAVERALAPGDVALLLTEPAMTNAGFLLPGPGFHDGLRELTRRHGTLLAIDETHTLVTAHGGLSSEWGLEPDLLTVGKSIAGGVPLGAYGMTDEVAEVLRPPAGGAAVSGIAYDEVATGGTLFANALSMAAARAALTEVLTPEAFITTARLGHQLAAGLRAHIDRAGLPWSVNVHGSHAFYFFSPEPPRDARGARDTDDPGLRALIRLFLANRGVWESGWWLGPTVSVAHTPQDVEAYLDAIGEFTEAIGLARRTGAMTADRCSSALPRGNGLRLSTRPGCLPPRGTPSHSAPPEPDPSRPTTKCDRNTLTGRARPPADLHCLWLMQRARELSAEQSFCRAEILDGHARRTALLANDRTLGSTELPAYVPWNGGPGGQPPLPLSAWAVVAAMVV